MASLIGATRKAALTPAITGALLYLLTTGPVSLRARLQIALAGLRIPQETAIKVLKWLLALGLIGTANGALNRLSHNYWQLSKQGAKWDFDIRRKNEIAVVTGGCSGIGLLTVKGLADHMRVVILDIQDPPAELKSYTAVSYYKCNITSADAVKEVAVRIRRDVGSPSILINNAGMGGFHPILESSEEFLETIFRVNLMSQYTTIKEFLPSMLENRKGHVVSIASLASYAVLPGISHYACTKAGVLALYEGLNQELKHIYKNGRCIQNTVVHPTWVQTPLIANHADTLTASGQKIFPAKLVSDAVVKQILSGKASQIFVPGQTSTAKLLRAFPQWLQEFTRDSHGAKASRIPR